MSYDDLYQIIRGFGYTTSGQSEEIARAILAATPAPSVPVQSNNKAALQWLADQAQELDMGYGPSVPVQAGAVEAAHYYLCPRCDKATVEGAVHTCTPPAVEHAKRAEGEREKFDAFMLWAGKHLGQGYSLELDKGSFVDPVTRWTFVGYKAGLRAQQAGGDAVDAAKPIYKCHDDGKVTLTNPMSLREWSGIDGAQQAGVEAAYQELIYAVGNKYKGETRHQTALRYIRQAENINSDAARAASDTQGEGKNG